MDFRLVKSHQSRDVTQTFRIGPFPAFSCVPRIDASRFVLVLLADFVLSQGSNMSLEAIKDKVFGDFAICGAFIDAFLPFIYVESKKGI
jgi:hypothetical protein